MATAGPKPDSQSRVGKSFTFLIFSSNFDQFFLFFLKLYVFSSSFGPPGGRIAHPGRPWLRHWATVGRVAIATQFISATDRIDCSIFFCPSYFKECVASAVFFFNCGSIVYFFFY